MQAERRLSEILSTIPFSHRILQRKPQNRDLLLMYWDNCRSFVSSTYTLRYQDNFAELSAILNRRVGLRRLFERQHTIHNRL